MERVIQYEQFFPCEFMIISLFLMTRDLKKDQFIGSVPSDYFNKIKSLEDQNIRFFSCIDPYDSTFFNKNQMQQLKKELKFLKNYQGLYDKQFAILNYAVEFASSQDDFTFLVLVGD